MQAKWKWRLYHQHGSYTGVFAHKEQQDLELLFRLMEAGPVEVKIRSQHGVQRYDISQRDLDAMHFRIIIGNEGSDDLSEVADIVLTRISSPPPQCVKFFDAQLDTWVDYVQGRDSALIIDAYHSGRERASMMTSTVAAASHETAAALALPYSDVKKTAWTSIEFVPYPVQKCTKDDGTVEIQPLFIPPKMYAHGTSVTCRYDATTMQASTAYDEAVAHLPKDLANIMRCPITKRVLRVPVTASDGHTYEHGELIHWMESNDTSPVTGQHLSPKLIFNNQAQKFIRNLAPKMEEAFGASQEDTGLQPSPKREVIVLDSNDNVREPRMPKEDDPEDDEDDEDKPLLKKSGGSSGKKRMGSPEEKPEKQKPTNASNKDDDDDEYSIPNMINNMKRRRMQSEIIAKKVDAIVDQRMQNGVKINPVLRKMFDR